MTQWDVTLAMRHWIFPVGGLNLSKIDVKESDLVAQRDAYIANVEM